MSKEKLQPIETIKEIGQNACNLTLLAALSAAVGVIAGIFLAPKPGKELRKELQDKSSQFFKKAKQQVADLNEKFHPKMEEFGSKMSMTGN